MVWKNQIIQTKKIEDLDLYLALGKCLEEARCHLQELHPAIRRLVMRGKMNAWYDRSDIGWSHDEISELSYFLVKQEDKPDEIQECFGSAFVWRVERGIPCRRRSLLTYCYILGFNFSFQLVPID